MGRDKEGNKCGIM